MPPDVLALADRYDSSGLCLLISLWPGSAPARPGRRSSAPILTRHLIIARIIRMKNNHQRRQAAVVTDSGNPFEEDLRWRYSLHAQGAARVSSMETI